MMDREVGATAMEKVGIPTVVVCVSVAAAKPVVADQAAVSKHVPGLSGVTTAVAVPALTVTGPTEQIPPVPVIVGATPAFVVAVTVKVMPTPAVAGAPVKLTVGDGSKIAKRDHAEERGAATNIAGFGLAGRKASLARTR